MVFLVGSKIKTLSELSAESQFQIVLDAIKQEEDSFFIFSKANADTDGRVINSMIDEFVKNNPNISKAFSTLGTLRFLSVLKVSDAIIGNSSSGIIEAPSLGIATINLGNRQKGRIQAKSVINCKIDTIQFKEVLEKTKDQNFKNEVVKNNKPYGEGNTTEKIMNILKQTNFNLLKTKKFYDLKI